MIKNMSKETSIYCDGAIATGIDAAGGTADTYITAVDQNGIKVHAANNVNSNYAAIDATGMEVVRGGTSMAKFGEVTRIGKAYVSGATDNESHMELDYHSLKLVDREGNEFFKVEDLRATNGIAQLITKYIGDGETKKFDFQNAYPDNTSYTVTVSDNSGGSQTKSTYSITFSSAPTKGAVITVTYDTSSRLVKTYTAGFRDGDYSAGPLSLAEGYNTVANGFASHAEGLQTKALREMAHAEGTTSIASGISSHAEGSSTTASGGSAHAEGHSTQATASHAHAEGVTTTASGTFSHAEGSDTTASGMGSHAEGADTTASGYYSHAEGYGSASSGTYSHAEGLFTEASGDMAHAQNYGTVAGHDNQTAIGKYNNNDSNNAFEIGNGTADDARSNALTVAWDGTMNIATPLPKTSGGTGQTGISQSTVTLSGCTVSGQRCWHNGVTCSVTMIDVKLSSALANGSSVAFGTIPSGYRPSEILYDVASSPNATFCGRLVFRIDQNGQLSLVNRSGSNLPANTAFSLFVTYAV